MSDLSQFADSYCSFPAQSYQFLQYVWSNDAQMLNYKDGAIQVYVVHLYWGIAVYDVNAANCQSMASCLQ